MTYSFADLPGAAKFIFAFLLLVVFGGIYDLSQLNNLSQIFQALANAGAHFDNKLRIDVLDYLLQPQMWPIAAEALLSLVGMYAISVFYNVKKSARFWVPFFFLSNGALQTYLYFKTWGNPQANLYYILAYGQVYDSGLTGFAILGRFFAGYYFATNARVRRAFSSWESPASWRR